MKNKKKITLIALILLFILAIILLVLNQTGVINRIIENINKEEIKKEISYEVYKHVNGKTAMLVVAEDTENGIEKIIYPNNEMELYCNGKTKVAFDYNTDITGKESLTFKAINMLGEEIEKTIQINDQFYLDMIDHNLTKETETQKCLTVNYKEGSATKQYKIGEGETWTNYTNAIRLDDYQILETLENENKTPKVYLKQVDNIGNEIIVESKLNYTIPDNITYKQEETVVEGESILACVEDNELQTGNYIFRVTGTIEEQNEEGVTQTKTETIDYPVELYNYNEDANYKATNEIVINNTKYTGIGKTNSEKRMLILKYNKNLNIEENATITPTGTSETINEATHLCTKKGMFIYCAETLTNNGEITMTAKGTVNQEGENVYLYKNEDNTYEYVPAIGANGGSSVSHAKPGINGQSGTSRKTGGGGSGAGGYCGTAGAGGNGTSYSGGAGGGGAAGNASNQWGTGTAGSSIGGPGGNAGLGGSFSRSAGGGAGNPGGINKSISQNYMVDAENGTGGLLIIYTNIINNNKTISSKGSNGGFGSDAPGGGSGAGSINIFYKTSIERGTITANGGSKGSAPHYTSYQAANGGAGSITITNIIPMTWQE